MKGESLPNSDVWVETMIKDIIFLHCLGYKDHAFSQGRTSYKKMSCNKTFYKITCFQKCIPPCLKMHFILVHNFDDFKQCVQIWKHSNVGQFIPCLSPNIHLHNFFSFVLPTHSFLNLIYFCTLLKFLQSFSLHLHSLTF